MFFEVAGVLYRVLIKSDSGVWAISCESPAAPQYITATEMSGYPCVAAPQGYAIQQEPLTQAQQKKQALIAPLVQDSLHITDKVARRKIAEKIAQENKTTIKRVLRLYYSYLAHGGFETEKHRSSNTGSFPNFKWAIEKYYFSANRVSLHTAYDLMLAERYMTPDGKLMDHTPSWSSFRHYFYDRGFHRCAKRSIARDGLSHYQRTERPLCGSAMAWRDKIGVYQMDATQADIFLVSRFDRSAVIGRPYVYLAVDVTTQLITGFYVGLEAGENAVIACLVNAASDKVAYCARYGIEILPEQWPSAGLPGEIVTDNGREFIGSRVDELCAYYGMERETLPPFRPDRKGLVEKAFDLLQQRYKPLLRGKGIIEPDTQERWATDYRSQATLDLTEFTKILIHCIVYLNAHRVLANYIPSPEMANDAVNPISTCLWEWYERMGRSLLIPADEEELYHLTLRRDTVRLTRRGVARDGIWYTCEDYKELLRKFGTKKDMVIAYDRDDIDSIYLVVQGKYYPLTLAPSCEQYRGMSACEQDLFYRKTQQQKKELEQQKTLARIAVIQNICSITDQVDVRKKKQQNGAAIKENREEERRKRT